MHGVDLARVIREALAQALVFYYPLAGRLREGPDDGWLYVDCTGEGIVFVEADANVELARLGDPPFSCLDELVCNVSSSLGITDSHHLIYIQVTRMKCGGFILGLHYNHAVSDTRGINQFLSAVGEIARGGKFSFHPSRLVQRHFQLPISTSPRKKSRAHPNRYISHHHTELLFFGPSRILAIRKLLPNDQCTTFVILTAYLWRRNVAASQFDPEHIVCLSITCCGLDNKNISVIPKGYYGNSIQLGMSETNARELCERPMEYAIGLVRKAKEDGFKRLMNFNTYPSFPSGKSYFMVSDMRRLRSRAADFGWGEPACADRGKAWQAGTYFLPYRNRDGEDGVLVMFCWPSEIVERFESEVSDILVQGS